MERIGGTIIVKVLKTDYTQDELERLMREALENYPFFIQDNHWFIEGADDVWNAIDLKQTLSNMEIFDIEMTFNGEKVD